ncbi:MAG: hypothetical protein WAO71_00635 [Gallionella sp.]
MSILRINHTKIEIRKFKFVIERLISTYASIFNEYDSTDNQTNIEDENADDADFSYIDHAVNLKTFAQFQIELILVKHVALVENMLIEIFRHLTCLLNHEKYQKKYFDTKANFSNTHVAVNKIAELTGNKIKIEGMKFWFFYDVMRNIRHHIAHGAPAFKMKHGDVKNFNEQFDLIFLYSEVNECPATRSFYPSLLHPTHSEKSEWFCHMSDNIKALLELNEEFYKFVEEVREMYISFGDEKEISRHALYGQIPK